MLLQQRSTVLVHLALVFLAAKGTETGTDAKKLNEGYGTKFGKTKATTYQAYAMENGTNFSIS